MVHDAVMLSLILFPWLFVLVVLAAAHRLRSRVLRGPWRRNRRRSEKASRS